MDRRGSMPQLRLPVLARFPRLMPPRDVPVGKFSVQPPCRPASSTPRAVVQGPPLITREIVYRLCRDQARPTASGSCRRGFGIADGKSHRADPHELRQGALHHATCQDVRHWPFKLHHHFKSATTMSPLQFQKQLRLQEARRLLVATPTMRRPPHTESVRRSVALQLRIQAAVRRLPMRDVERLRSPPRERARTRHREPLTAMLGLLAPDGDLQTARPNGDGEKLCCRSSLF